MEKKAPATVDELGLPGCLYLWALLIGQQRRLAIAPTRRMSLACMAALAETGVIEVPWPKQCWEVQPDAQTTPIEGLQWRLSWEIYEPARLVEALEDFFDSIERDEFWIAIYLRLWMDLGSAEAERYFEQQLVKNRFPAEWAQDMAFVYRETKPALSIAQWRYCGWAAVRRGASMAMQEGIQAAGLREAIHQEIRKRATLLTSGEWNGGSFSPSNPSPESAIARGYVQEVACLGTAYWTARPSDLELLAPRLRRGRGEIQLESSPS